MKKRVFALLRPFLPLLLLCLPAAAAADVVLPATGRLAGALDPAVSEFGDEFFNFPAFLGQRPAPGGTKLSGWIEIQFAPPAGDTVDFILTYHAVGTPDQIAWGGGQQYQLLGNEAFNDPLPFGQPIPNFGRLNLVTGEVVQIQINSTFLNTIIGEVDKVNRIPFGFPSSYPPPPPPPGFPLPPFPPGFLIADAKFLYGPSQKIIGFEFHGRSILPVGILGALGLFPPFSFGPNGEFYFANPTLCIEGTPPENCPTERTNPDGIVLSPTAFFHPHFDLLSAELEEVPVVRTVPPCGPVAVGDGGALVTAGQRLYQIGGRSDSGVSGGVQVYDAATNSWSAGPPLPRAVAFAPAAAIGGRIYVVGGRTNTGGVTNLLQILDIATGVWSTGRRAPLPLTGAAAVAVGGKLYVLGGKTVRVNGSPAGNLRFNLAVLAYDPTTNTWRTVATLPPDSDGHLGVEGAAAAAVGARIYLLNGRTMAAPAATQRVLIFDTGTRRFSEGPQTVAGVMEATAGVTGGRLYLVGGRAAPGLPTVPQLQVLDFEAGTWRLGLEEPLPTAASGGAVLDGELFVAGGRIQTDGDPAPGEITNAFQAFDPARGWEVCATQPLFTSADVFNAAAPTVGPPGLAPGSLAIIDGSNLASGSADAPPGAPVPTALGGVAIAVDGLPAPILSVRPTRITFEIPFGVAAGDGQAELELTRDGFPPAAVEIPVAEVGPGIFITNFGELHTAVFLEGNAATAFNEDGKLNSTKDPAHRGETVTVRMTGLGPVVPALANGERAPAVPPSVALFESEVSAVVGGLSATVVSVTLAPGEVGTYDVRVVVPADCPLANRVQVEIAVQGAVSNLATITVLE